MNVLHVIASMRIGGAELLVCNILENRYPDTAWHLAIINDEIDESLRERLVRIRNVKIFYLNKKVGSKNGKHILQLRRILIDYHIQIVHTHSFAAKIWTAFAVLLSFKKIKSVTTVHGMKLYSQMPAGEKFLGRVFPSEYIAISKSVQEEIRHELKISTSKIHVIYNGIDTRRYNLPKINHERFVIACIARISPYTKGQDILIKALPVVASRYPDICCRFIGDVHRTKNRVWVEDYTFLEELAASLKVANQVEFAGARRDIPEVLRGIDLVILPSRFEGFGLSILEAMAAKVPVIASDVDGPKEIIRHGYNGLLFEKGNSSDLAEQMIAVLKNPAYGKKLAGNAFREIGRYDIRKMGSQYVALYQAIR